MHQPDIHRRTEVVIGQPVQSLDLARQRLDRTNPLRMGSAGMGGAPGNLQFDERRPLPPRHEITARPTGLPVENGAGVPGSASMTGRDEGEAISSSEV